MNTITTKQDQNLVFELNDISRYNELKAKCKKAWVEFAEAIIEIRDSKLYRIDYGTFEEFCETELGLSKTHSNRLISAAEVINILEMTPIGVNLPQTEGQTRPLTKLEPELQPYVWVDVVNSNDKITAKKVEEKVSEYQQLNQALKEEKKIEINIFNPNPENAYITQKINRLQELPIEKQIEQIQSIAKEIRTAKKEEIISKRKELYETLSKQILDVSDKKYRIIYADPPWKYSNAMPEYVTEPQDYYLLMDTSEICAMPVKDITEQDAVLFLWSTSPHLPEAFEVLKAWGFTYKTTFIWDKIKHNIGHYNSVRHEILIVATKGSCTPDVKKLYDSVVSVERTEHSKKPIEFRNIIETLYTYGNKIELFSRANTHGWDVFGNQIN